MSNLFVRKREDWIFMVSFRPCKMLQAKVNKQNTEARIGMLTIREDSRVITYFESKGYNR